VHKLPLAFGLFLCIPSVLLFGQQIDEAAAKVIRAPSLNNAATLNKAPTVNQLLPVLNPQAQKDQPLPVVSSTGSMPVILEAQPALADAEAVVAREAAKKAQKAVPLGDAARDLQRAKEADKNKKKAVRVLVQ
jgi:hypothetical protein